LWERRRRRRETVKQSALIQSKGSALIQSKGNVWELGDFVWNSGY
jgi:hypothetical protein